MIGAGQIGVIDGADLARLHQAVHVGRAQQHLMKLVTNLL
jgi:ketopantoate reductase